MNDSPGLTFVEMEVCSEDVDIFLSADVDGPFIDFSACLKDERSDGFRSALLLDLVRREEDSASRRSLVALVTDLLLLSVFSVDTMLFWVVG